MVWTPADSCACALCSKNLPTVRPAADFDAEKDAIALSEAMKGVGCNNEEVANVLSRCSAAQRNATAQAYKEMYGRDLNVDLEDELGGNLEILVLALMNTWPQLCAKSIHRACEGAGTEVGTLIWSLCTASNCQIKEIIAAYKELYGGDLQELIKEELSGDFENMMVAILQGARDEDGAAVDYAQARADAEKLHEAGELKWGTDEDVFVSVILRNSYDQLNAVNDAYHELTGKTLEDAVDADLNGDLRNAAKTILRIAKNKDGFWAKHLFDSMEGEGCNDKLLIHIIVLRSEIDLGNIAKEYQAQYGTSLAQAVADDTSGDYKNLLLAIIGSG